MNKLCICLKSVNFVFRGKGLLLFCCIFLQWEEGGVGTVKIWIRYALVVVFFGGGWVKFGHMLFCE